MWWQSRCWSRSRQGKKTCYVPDYVLSVAGALVPAAAREEAQEARLRRRVLRICRLFALLRFWPASATGHLVPSPKKQRLAASKPIHGSALQGTVVPGKYRTSTAPDPRDGIRDGNRTSRAKYWNRSTFPPLLLKRIHRWCQLSEEFTLYSHISRSFYVDDSCRRHM